MQNVPVHGLFVGKPTKVEAGPNDLGGHWIRITHGEDFIITGNATTVRKWINQLRSEVVTAIERAERQAAA